MHNHSLIQTNRENPLILSQINALALSKSHIEQSESSRNSALNERLSTLEEKIRSLLEENLRIKAELNEARALYQKRQQDNTSTKNLLLDEIAPLEEKVNELTLSVKTLIQTNENLSNHVNTTRMARDKHYNRWYKSHV